MCVPECMYVCAPDACRVAKEECRGPWNWSSGWLSHLMSSARAVSALPHWDISSAWAWLFWAFGCCRDSLAGLLILLCLKLPLPYPHTEVPLPYPHTEVPRHTEYGVWAHSRFECRGCFQYIQSQKTIGWFQKAGQEKTHECFTNFGQEQVSSTVPEPLQVTTQMAGKTDLHTEAHMGRLLQRCYDTTLRGKMHHGVDRDMQTSDSSGPVRTGQLSCISSSTRSKWWEPASQSLWHSAFAEMLRWGKEIAAAADGREDRDWLPK